MDLLSFLLALGMKIFDEVLHQVHALLNFDLIHFYEILKQIKTRE